MALSYKDEGAKAFYDRLPVFGQNALTSAYGLRRRIRIHGRAYSSALASLQESQWWDQERVNTARDARCAEFLTRAAKDSPYWKSAFAEAGLAPERLSVGALVDLPVLTKEQLLEAIDRVVARPWATGATKGVWVQTSGTTGTGLRMVLSRECWQREYAFQDLHRSWGGIRRGDSVATLAGHPVVPTEVMTPPFWRRNHADNQTLFSSQHMTRTTLPAYLDELRRLSPKLIHGYPSSLYLVASFCLETGEDRIRPVAVYCHSETLFDWQRAVIEEAFGCKLFNEYGNTELTACIVECEHGRLHVKNEYSLIEFLRTDGTPAAQGEYARVVTTGFWNDATPLVRYDTGDMAVLSGLSCECGRPGPVVEEILGRQDDIFVTPDGRMVGRLDHVFKGLVNVAEAQLIQDTSGLVRAKIVRRPAYTAADEQHIERELRLRLGEQVAFEFEYVDQIPRERNGKFRFAISRVPLPLASHPGARGSTAADATTRTSG